MNRLCRWTLNLLYPLVVDVAQEWLNLDQYLAGPSYLDGHRPMKPVSWFIHRCQTACQVRQSMDNLIQSTDLGPGKPRAPGLWYFCASEPAMGVFGVGAEVVPPHSESCKCTLLTWEIPLPGQAAPEKDRGATSRIERTGADICRKPCKRWLEDAIGRVFAESGNAKL